MYFQPDGRVRVALETSKTIALHLEIATADDLGESCLSKREVREQIRRAVTAVADNCVSPVYQIHWIAVVRLEVDVQSRPVIEKVLRIPLSCDGAEDSASKTSVPIPADTLRGFASGQALRACERYRVGQFIDEMNAVAKCLRTLRHWSGNDVHEIIVALELLELLAERHGHRIEDFYQLERRPTPLPDGIWPGGLDVADVWYWDRSGNTLIIDQRGRLVEGPTATERLGWRRPGEPAATFRIREIERGRIETEMAEWLWSAEDPKEAEWRADVSGMPF